MSDVASRCLAAPGFRWMAGMLARSPYGLPIRVITGAGPVPAEAPAWGADDVGNEWRIEDVALDIDDAATLGCLLSLVRERWADPYLCVVNQRPDYWQILSTKGGLTAATEAEALIAALEAPRG